MICPVTAVSFSAARLPYQKYTNQQGMWYRHESVVCGVMWGQKRPLPPIPHA
ncbi:MAG: hypothetical protein IAF02_15795 [Anaerolineae bacterium]|nr:hypothetical protein [Anaerolineae bacterium]